jgi:phosphoglycolate phosphatase
VTAELLDGIELVIFDKDGTLIDFQAMWGGWVRALADDLAGETGLDVTATLFDLLGVDPTSGIVHSHGLLAATAMSRIKGIVVDVIVGLGMEPDAAGAAVDRAWHPPDPVDLAQPTADLGELFDQLGGRGLRIAVATSDDRLPTERTLAALGVAARVVALACADDGGAIKPAADPVLRLCETLGVEPGRSMVVGDSPADLAMGRAAGAGRVVGVLTGVGDRATLAGADAILVSVAELLAG